MNSKIDGLGGLPSPYGAGAVNTRAGGSHDSRAIGAATGDTVRLTDGAAQMQALAGRVAAASDLDLDKVRAIRADLDAGRYQIDPTRIAESLLSLERALTRRV